MGVQGLDGFGWAPARLLVDVTAWGRTEELAQRAVMKAAVGPARSGWDFAEVELIHDRPCPFNAADPDPGALAADADYDWAYVVRKHDGAAR